MNYALIFAGGRGERMKSPRVPKQFLTLYGKPLIVYTLEVFEGCPEIDGAVVACLAGWEEYLRGQLRRFGIRKVLRIVEGGRTSQESKWNALECMKEFCAPNDIVLIHDAVRPLIDEELIRANIAAVRQYGSAVSAVPFTETGIEVGPEGRVIRTHPRHTLHIARAPQSFYFGEVYAAHAAGRHLPDSVTVDTCTLMAALGKTLHAVPCDASNIKITTPEDFELFKALTDRRGPARTAASVSEGVP